MPAPKRRHPPRPSAPPAPLEPLGAIVRDYEQWRRGQSGKPGRGALREYWQQRDRQHGQRPDYALWRQTQCPESPPERRQDPVELAVRALRAPEPLIGWPVLAMVPGLLHGAPRREELIKAVLARLESNALPAAPFSCALVRWLCRVETKPETTLKDLHDLILTTTLGWKPGRAADLGFLKTEGWVPVPPSALIRRTAAAIHRLATTDAPAWHLTAWMLLRDLRPPQSPARPDELEALLDAAYSARLGGDHHAAARLAALFVHLLPPQAPEALSQRARVAAWLLAEAGLTAPAGLRVSLEELPFPGDAPTSEKGLEATRQFHDPADPWQKALSQEVATDPEWQRLREGGVALHHPLAALAWIARKAQSYVVKKQFDLLRAAAVLAARHHCIGTTGRILAEFPTSADAVLAFAKAMRESLRRMPFLRDSQTWQDWTTHLRAAWGKLEADAIHDPETVLFLHETLLDREVTALRSLPLDLRLLALRHIHSRRSPSALVQALETDPRQMQQMEHQRAVELWSIASMLRERADQTGTAWVSLVLRGDLASGKYSLLVQTAAGRVQSQGRMKGDWAPVLNEIATACSSAESIYLAIDPELATSIPWETGLTTKIAFIPSWEWAFRVLRETPAETPPEVLIPEGAELAEPPPPLPHTCLLLGGPAMADANTRWLPARPEERPQSKRSLSIGAHASIVSLGPLQSGVLSMDLVRLSLAQSARSVVIRDKTGAPRVRGLAQMMAKEPTAKV